MKRITILIAIFTTVSICAALSLIPSDTPKKSDKTTFVLNDTTYGKWGDKEYRVIKPRLRPCQLLQK